MGQRYKSIYYSDYPAETPRQKSLTLAFGDRDRRLYESVKVLSSHELRELIGHSTFASLQSAAEQDGLSIGTYCLRLLRQKTLQVRDPSQQYLLPGFAEEPPSLIEPLQVTFKGGQAEPLHAWYPYLAGYSPRFVEQALQEFAPNATHVLDPFAGTGTTPLTVARLDKRASYCELNPLLQYLTDVKALALTLSDASRQRIAAFLETLAVDFEAFLSESAPDISLKDSYIRTFEKSRFFDEQTFQQVLQARSAIDRLACTDPLAARFMTVAVLASLIPASRLIRRGDVRFKTEGETRRNAIRFVTAVRQQMTLIATDIRRLVPFEQRPTLVCADARDLGKLPRLDIDAVITSPPYLNGTNYFRNTKIELWFLRCLRSSADLSLFRHRAVTAGINDVTIHKANGEGTSQTKQVIARLEASAYDPRIPRMVDCYFTDMKAVLRAIRPHLLADAVIVMDIGDSSYGNVHVPTDALLSELFTEEGFRQEREITLRRRMSRGGFPLSQKLLVFRLPKPRTTRVKETAASLSPHWLTSLTTFKSELPHQHGEFAKRNWGHPLHSLCSYQGKMKPSLAAHLVKTFVSPGGTLLDPFAGVGTIPFEAALHGVRAWAFEISPAALCIAAAKLGRPDAETCEGLLNALDAYLHANQPTESELSGARTIHFNGALPDYFEPRTLREVLLARRYFMQHPPQNASETLVLASLLHVLHGNRPYALSRRSHPITPFAPTGPAEYRPLIPRLRDKVSRGLYAVYPKTFVEGCALYQDATSWWPQQIEALDAIITSPPFFDSTRFYLANWMRLWFCGWEAADFRTRPLAFVDEQQKAGFEVYEPIFRQARERLKPDGVMVLHLGKSRKCDMAWELSRLAARWFRVTDSFSESVGHCESHGIRDKGTVEEHQYLVLE
jgi:tRNA G10  N-methylase Trm11